MVRLGIVGLGGQVVKRHIPALETCKNVQLSAVCDIDDQSRDLYPNDGVLPCYASHTEMFESGEVDAVLVATPHSTHFEVCKDALNSGLHVLKEKPFALSVADGLALEEIAKRKELTMMTCTQRRYIDSFRSLKSLLPAIGDVYTFNARYSMNIENLDEGWRASSSTAGGGCLIDMGYHIIDLVLWYFGMPAQVETRLSNMARPYQNYNVEDTASMLFGWERMHGTVQISRVMPPKSELFEVYGTKGSVKVSADDFILKGANGQLVCRVPNSSSSSKPYSRQLEHFAFCIENRVTPPSHNEHLSLIEECYRKSIDVRKIL